MFFLSVGRIFSFFFFGLNLICKIWFSCSSSETRYTLSLNMHISLKAVFIPLKILVKNSKKKVKENLGKSITVYPDYVNRSE